MALVTVPECCFSTPRIIMHRCCASATTPTPSRIEQVLQAVGNLLREPFLDPMSIEYSPETASFHLKSRESSYVVGIDGGKHPASLYWGRRLRTWTGVAASAQVVRPFTPNPDPTRPGFSLDTLPREYPAFGNTDFRSPAFQVLQEDGSTIADLSYRSHRIFAGKPPLAGLPSTYVESETEADTLEIELFDELIGLEVSLSYTIFWCTTP